MSVFGNSGRIASNRRCIIFIILIILLWSGIVPVVSAAESQSIRSSEINTTGSETPVTPTLKNQNTTIEAIIRFDQIDEKVLSKSASPVLRMRKHAEQTQNSFYKFASKTDSINVKNRFWIMNAMLVEIKTGDIDIDELAVRANVTHVDENYQLDLSHTASSVSDSTLHPVSPTNLSTNANRKYTYGLSQISAPAVWEKYDTRGRNTTVAILDTGIDTRNHSDLRSATIGWKDFINKDNSPYDDNGHGTHVSGTVVGEKRGDGTSYGVAPEAKLLHGKVFNKYGSSNISLILEGIEWAVVHDADVISMSFGTQPGFEAQFIEPLQNAREAGVIFVSVAGNTGPGTSSSPGNIFGVVSTAASAEDRTIAPFSGGERINTTSAWGRQAPSDWPGHYRVPTVSAPGVMISSAASGGGYQNITGTSMAAPHVVGALALLQSSTDDELTPVEMKTALQSTASKPPGNPKPPDTRYGHGIINVSAAASTVAEPATYQIDRFTTPASILRNYSYTVRAQATNVGDARGVQTIEYRLVSEDGDTVIVNETQLTLAGGKSTHVRTKIPATETANLTGNYTHILETPTETRNYSTTAISNALYSDPAVTRFDTNNDGRIIRAEVTGVVNAYFADQTTTSRRTVTAVINAYFDTKHSVS